jgi:hypothetical protein
VIALTLADSVAAAGVLIAGIGVASAMWFRRADAAAETERHEERMQILTRDVLTKMDLVEVLRSYGKGGS